jgi:GTP-binding protein Era
MANEPPRADATRCGTIAILGPPNAGKSSLLNAIVGQKLAITSSKPQSTRQPVVGIWTEGDTQLIFVDQPGLLDPQYPLQEAMCAFVETWTKKADTILYVHAVTHGPPPSRNSIDAKLGQVNSPLAIVLTNADRVNYRSPARPHDDDTPVFLVSSTTGHGLAELLSWCRRQAPPRLFLHDPEHVSTQPLRFFASELVREAAFELLDEELPYAMATETEEFREQSDPVYIRVTLYVERESQRRMVIGKGGRTIRALGATARRNIEVLLGARVYLDLWVKVLPKWRSRPHALGRLGFPVNKGGGKQAETP